MPAINTIPSPEMLNDLARRGQAIYEQTIEALLKPQQDKQFVAIHLDSEDFAVARSSGDAMRALRLRHPDGQLFIRKIGNEPEYGLAARLLAGTQSKHAK